MSRSVPPGALIPEELKATMLFEMAGADDQPTQAGDLHERLLRIVEPPLLQTVLQRHRGQFLAAAKELGLHRVTLKRKMNLYGEVEGEP